MKFERGVLCEKGAVKKKVILCRQEDAYSARVAVNHGYRYLGG